ncbi:multidrug effflux MFS transporter [Brevibacillus humidisoli]|uniref:multidrug effflux MFS transporter n=1 Tax=Brevibacillus humidisoli TaxID=2895522 RepID=UPI001E613B2B|nr:multidrug effflux MFS transporter [Brevibacillus humidisoli]UFJ42982.1 multidrug effflux MFS transporter [Brevibacillus humidisoli]
MNETNTRRQPMLLLLLIALVCLPQASIGLYTPSLPKMTHYFHTTHSQIQLTITLYTVGYAISVLICGILSDRFGRKPILISGTVIYVAATFVALYAKSVETFIVCRFFQALGGCCGTVVARLITKDIYQHHDQIRILTYLSTAIAITPAIAPIVGGILETYYGWQLPFSLLLVLSIGMLAVLCFCFTETHHDRNSSLNLSTIIRSYGYLLTHRHFLAYSLAISLAWCAYFSFISYSPYLLQNLLGVTPVFYGISFALVVIGYITGTTLTRKVSGKWDLNRIILYGSLLSMIASLFLLIVIELVGLSVAAIILPMMVVMVGVGAIFPACHAAVMQPFPSIAGTASGLLFFIQMIAGALCNVIVDPFVGHTHLPMVLAIVISSMLLFVCFYFMGWKQPKSQLPTTSSHSHQ